MTSPFVLAAAQFEGAHRQGCCFVLLRRAPEGALFRPIDQIPPEALAVARRCGREGVRWLGPTRVAKFAALATSRRRATCSPAATLTPSAASTRCWSPCAPRAACCTCGASRWPLIGIHFVAERGAFVRLSARQRQTCLPLLGDSCTPRAGRPARPPLLQTADPGGRGERWDAVWVLPERVVEEGILLSTTQATDHYTATLRDVLARVAAAAAAANEGTP